MVNASLNWASIVGIVLAVCGGGLYFLRSFKPALARDYDVFFAAIGLLCGGILFFQGWRLDPILQFGQFLLAGTTVFFAYESVRLRGITTDQARRSSFFEDDDMPNMPRTSSRSRREYDYDEFKESPISSKRRFQSREFDEEEYEDDRYRQRRSSRAIPESAVSRRNTISTNEKLKVRDLQNRNQFSEDTDIGSRRSSFGERRNTRSEIKRGSRPLANQKTSRRTEDKLVNKSLTNERRQSSRTNLKNQTSTETAEDASFIDNNIESTRKRPARRTSDPKTTFKNQKGRYNVSSKSNKPRDNSSRFDD